ncbi:unnamed protein product [Diabrotica balteata]|uniref:Uncharacterized protein n=1 Tax=Diabrotica balteata TaxID=107213 RepID=A0A9N9T5J0_DIABA|nr:unnamed protein product [Diabrotica balteata]
MIYFLTEDERNEDLVNNNEEDCKEDRVETQAIYYDYKNEIEDEYLKFSPSHVPYLVGKDKKDTNRDHPSNIIMIDFQLSFLHSPVIDLSYFWHFVASTHEYPHLAELLEFYHKELSMSLKLLGCNSEELFSLDTLWTHWKKYSIYGFIQAVLFTYLLYVEKDDLQKINDGSQGTKVQKLVGVQLKNDEAYVQRISTLIDYYKLD